MIIYPPSPLARNAARIITQGGLAHVNVKEWYRLASGMYSPVYLDLRNLPGVFGWWTLVNQLGSFVNWGKREGHMEDFDSIFGIPEGATSMAAVLACHLHSSHLRIRSTTKDHGVETSFLGAQHSKRSFLLEDTSSTAASTIKKGVEPLRKLGIEVSSAFFIASHDIGAKEALEKVGVQGFCLCRPKEIFTMLRSEKSDLLLQGEWSQVFEWFEDPKAASNEYLSKGPF